MTGGEEGDPRVDVVVLDWNGGTETLACLASVYDSRGVDLRVLLVDNASAESVVDRACRRFPSLRAFRNPENLGYAGGNNVGLKAALADGAQAVVLLNNDARVGPDTLRRLVATAASDPSIAAVGCRILRSDRIDRLWMAWGELSYRQSLVRLVGQGRIDGDLYRERRDVPWVSGCGWLLTRSALERVGLLDEDYFAYHEEVDWCARARGLGLRVVYEGQASVTHRGEGSSGGGYVSRKQYLVGRNMVRFVRRHGSIAQRLQFTTLFLGSLPFQLLRRVWAGEGAGVWLKLRGARDAYLHRPLPRDELGLDS